MNLKDLLEDFDVPSERRDTSRPENLRWLVRNIGIANGQHINLEQAKRLIRQELRRQRQGDHAT